MKIFVIRLAVSILSLVGLSGSLTAGTIIQNASVFFNQVNATATGTGSDLNFVDAGFGLNKFDTSLGTLNSITFDVSFGGFVFQELSVQSNSQAQANTQSRLAFRADGLNDLFTEIEGHSFPTRQGGSTSVSFGFSDTGSHTTVSAGTMANFSGSGFIPSFVRFDNFAGITTDFGSATAIAEGCSFGSVCPNPAVNVSLTLTYNFTEAEVSVPEPDSLAILAIGLAGICVARRRAVK